MFTIRTNQHRVLTLTSTCAERIDLPALSCSLFIQDTDHLCRAARDGVDLALQSRDSPLRSGNLSTVRVGTIDVTTVEDHDLALIRHNHQARRVANAMHVRHLDPSVGSTVLCVEPERLKGTVADDDGAVDTAGGCPDDVGRCRGNATGVGCLEEHVRVAAGALHVVGVVEEGVVNAVGRDNAGVIGKLVC
jgi:hypothetical protein